MKEFWRIPWFIRLVSLLIAILLVIYVNYTQNGFWTQGQEARTQQTVNKTQTIKVPLQVSVDTDKYYVVGYPEKVSITLEGSTALVTSTINTQNFRVYIDLTNKRIGEQKVRVHVTGISKQLSYTINPKVVRVNIQQRKSTALPVQTEYNKSAIAHNYKIGRASVNPQQVEVTGARSEVNQIDQIVAKVALPNGINHTYERQVSLLALDSKGRQLNVIIEPATAQVTIPITVAKKNVKISLQPKHEQPGKIYSLTAKNNYVTLYGSEEAVARVKHLGVPIDLSEVNVSTTKIVPLSLPQGIVKADPSQVSVELKVEDANNSKTRTN